MFTEIPVERARLLRDLLSAAQTWRGSLIPSTSTGVWMPTRNLLAAIAALDPVPCDHPRSWRVFRISSLNADEGCGYCGTTLVAGITQGPPSPLVLDTISPALGDPATSSPQESSSSAP
jgi:hypothetical protein